MPSTLEAADSYRPLEEIAFAQAGFGGDGPLPFWPPPQVTKRTRERRFAMKT